MIDKTHQSAVEWFYKWHNDNPEATIKQGLEAFEQAKLMEKKEIFTAYECGWIYGDLKKAPSKGEDYFHIINNIDVDMSL